MKSLDSEIVLFGTGVAPLVLAQRLARTGVSVLVLNPDWDFFTEDSEFGFEPLWSAGHFEEPEDLFQVIRDDFPGSIELPTQKGFRDAAAPQIRARSAVWIEDPSIATPLDKLKSKAKPSLGAGAVARFPGMSRKKIFPDHWVSHQISGLSDVDLNRYRAGLLEFVTERLGEERVICGVSDLEVFSEGIRFFCEGKPATARVGKLVVFWTPRLTSWILQQSRKTSGLPIEPSGLRFYEEWSLISRDPIDPQFFGYYEDFVLWADREGKLSEEDPSYHLHCLRRGKRESVMGEDGLFKRHKAPELATRESLEALDRLCREFLGWEKFSIRGLRPRLLHEWGEMYRHQPCAKISWGRDGFCPTWIVGGCEGPLSSVVRAVGTLEGYLG